MNFKRALSPMSKFKGNHFSFDEVYMEVPKPKESWIVKRIKQYRDEKQLVKAIKVLENESSELFTKH